MLYRQNYITQSCRAGNNSTSSRSLFQGLIFIAGSQPPTRPPFSSTTPSSPAAAYALLPNDFVESHPSVVRQFQQNNIYILNDLNVGVLLAHASNLHAVEVFLDGGHSDLLRWGHYVYVSNCFDKCGVHQLPTVAFVDPWQDIGKSRNRNVASEFGAAFADAFPSGHFSLTKKSSNVIQPAVDFINLKVLDCLFRRRVDIPCYFGACSKGNILHLAAYKGQLDFVTSLLNKGADVNCVSASHPNLTPLHFAVMGGSSLVVRLLVEWGADVNATDANGSIPLHLVEHPDVAEILLENGADANKADSKNQTPLQNVINTLSRHRDPRRYRRIGYFPPSTRPLDDATLKMLKAFTKYSRSVGVNDSQREATEKALATAEQEPAVFLYLLESCYTVPSVLVGGFPRRPSSPSGDLINLGGGEEGPTNRGGRSRGIPFLFPPQDPILPEVARPWRATFLAATHRAAGLMSPLSGAGWRSTTVTMFARHAVKIATLFPSGELVNDILSLWEGEKASPIKFKQECEEEIARMAGKKIKDKNESVLDVLRGSERKIIRLLRDQNAAQTLNSDEFTSEFKLYGGILRCRIKKGVTRKRLLEEVRDCFFFPLTEKFRGLPHEVRAYILEYLSTEDLLKLKRISSLRAQPNIT